MSIMQHVIELRRVLPSNGYPLTAAEILMRTTIGSARNIRKAAFELNSRGVPVVADVFGYRVATSWEQVRAYRRTLIAKAKGIMEHVRALDNLEANGKSRPARAGRKAVHA